MAELRSILIVDDSRFSQALIENLILEKHPDWMVEKAAHGEDALAKVATSDFDLITIDYNMPGMNGIELVEKLRQAGCQARLILLTANVQESMSQRAHSLDIGFVKKPITPESMAQVLTYLE
ncbi:response regulator [Desulfurispirillum indicum]|uniref:response regulator transcription factor n=1 Tax=Desulfurispirillum indicum TaxID=936456 RepID=UPI001CFA8803|nr:response regulator [Desulfurispirillum indicum]UCZ56663.1 response regulator [Desulfurispirillum indicum]